MTQFFSLSAQREKIDLNSRYLWRHMYTSLFNIYSDGSLNNWCKILFKYGFKYCILYGNNNIQYIVDYNAKCFASFILIH